ncbi:hypothetical protein VCR1J2_20380 [Vibrio coralliirubri]|nr:hypothetical protein VCR1J2_20380 [Vibrio coralliirubri]
MFCYFLAVIETMTATYPIRLQAPIALNNSKPNWVFLAKLLLKIRF